jgi:hypothetical protein
MPVVRLDELFEEKVSGKAVPVVKLSDKKLAW